MAQNKGTISANFPAHLKMMGMIFFTCLLVYLIFWSGHHYSIDGVVMFQYAKSLLFHNSFHMDPPVIWGPDTIEVSKWALGLTLVYMLVLAGLSAFPLLIGIDFSQIPYNPDILYNELLLYDRTYRFSSFVNPLITATTAILLYYLCTQLGLSQKRAAAAALIYGIASPAAVYAKLDFAQPLASLFIILAFVFFVRAKSHNVKNLVAAGVALSFATLARTEMILIPTVIFLIAAYFLEPNSQEIQPKTVDRLKNVFRIALPVIVFFILNQFVNYLRFDSWFGVGYSPENEFNLNLVAVFTAFLGNLLSPERGLLLYFPLVILSTFGLAALFKKDRLIGMVLVGTLLGSMLMYAMWEDWDAGVSWGPRFLIPILPYIVMLVFFADHHRISRPWKLALFLFFLILGAVAVFQGLLFTRLTGAERIVFDGSYSYPFDKIPFLVNWQEIFNPELYDIRLLNQIQETAGFRHLFLFGSIFLLGVISKVWFDFFVAKNKPPV